MRIGIDCDGVLRDLIPAIVDGIKTTHPPPDWWVKSCANNPSKSPEDV